MNGIYIEIESLESITGSLAEAKKKGLLKDISQEKVEMAFKDKTFPIRVPVNFGILLDYILAMGPMAKIFGKKIESNTIRFLEMAVRAG